MIPRYSRAEMSRIWEPENKFRIWFEIEAHACDAQAQLGVIPKESAKAVWEKGKFNIAKIDEIEKETKHDVLAFLTNLAESIGADARFVHRHDIKRCFRYHAGLSVKASRRFTAGRFGCAAGGFESPRD